MRIIISNSRAGALQYLLVRAQVRIYNSRRHVFLFTLLSISTFRARDCSGVMSRGFRFVHNYPIRAHIFVRVRIGSSYIIGRAEESAGRFTAIGRSAAVKALAFGNDRVRVRARALRSAQIIKHIFGAEQTAYFSIAMYYMRAVYVFLRSCIYNIIIKSVKNMRSFYFNL